MEGSEKNSAIDVVGEQPTTPIATGSQAGSARASSAALAAAEKSKSDELRVRLFARTDVGQVREHNEDNFLVADLSRRTRGLLEANRTTALGSQGLLFAVCDGMGGAAAGEVASQLAVDTLFEEMIKGIDASGATTRDEIARRLVESVEIAGARIYTDAKNDRSRRGMGTTATAAALVDSHLFLAQVGDSRGYLLRNGELSQVTRDQSLVNQLIEAGQLTEEEAESFEHNNIILQALGTAETVQVDLTYVALQKGDILMLCSDGLSGMVRADEIREILGSGNEPVEQCKMLTDRANQGGGHDNITVIVAHFDGEGLSGAAPGDEPVRYRKYTLPDATTSVPPATNASSTSHTNEASGLSKTSDAPLASPHNGDEPVELPRDPYVPAWLVIVLVLGVVLVLIAAGFVLLR